MQTFERVIRMRQGPPWGFQLEDAFNGSLIVSQIRRQSPADLAGLRENDVVLAINNYSTKRWNRAYAIDVINRSKYELDLVVQRKEQRKPQMMTFFLDTSAARGHLVQHATASRDLDISWRKEPTPPPEPPRIKPADPTVTPISLDRLLREFEVPKTKPSTTNQCELEKPRFYVKSSKAQTNETHESVPPESRNREVTSSFLNPQEILPCDKSTTPISLERLLRASPLPEPKYSKKKRTFANSDFYTEANVYYPSVEEQIEMARRVAKSIEAPVNQGSRGARMFEMQQQRIEKYVKEGPEPIPDPLENATPQQLEYMIPPAPPPPPAPTFPSLTSGVPPPPPPPPPPPGQPRSIQEFIEKMRRFPKNTHTEISPQVCFDIATALHNSGSRGGSMFAKRRAKAQNWEVESTDMTTPVLEPKQADRPQLMSKLEQQHQYQHQVYRTQQQSVPPPPPPSQQLSRNSVTSLTRMQEMSPRPQPPNMSQNAVQWQNITTNSLTRESAPSSSSMQPVSKPKWRPVKFNILQKAS